MTETPDSAPNPDERPDGARRHQLPGQAPRPDDTQVIRSEPARLDAPPAGGMPASAPAPTSGPQPGYQQPWAQPGYGQPSHAQPGQQQPGYGQPGAAYGVGSQPAGGGRSGRGGRGLAQIGAASLLAAALASAGTYAVVQRDDTGAVSGGGNSTVIKADPADFADAGAINWSATAAKVNPSVVSIDVSSGSSGGEGSGVVLDKSGNIVTNNHVVSGAGSNATVTVTLNNNRTYPASVVGTDPSTDLAVIRIKDVPDLHPVEMADDSKLVVGQPVMAVGNPLGLAGTVTTGIVSALDRPVTTSESESDSSSTSTSTVVTNAIQTSAAINPGNSGGALVNGSGKLIGINSSIASLSNGASGGQSGNIGIGFAIPSNVVKNISGQLIAKGKAEHALLGIGTSPTEVKSGNATLTAAKVASVAPGSGAAKAGLRKDDAITAIDGEPVTSPNALVGQVRSRTVGSAVKLTIIRDGRQQEVSVTLGAQSDVKN
ncbi:trypsin-like peptidase domain-containing protein [Dermacoccus nishinomiyaensis]|uniref:trypsin-like peptidase domain-containing protein n=1 Tax=Dermacoccus nishinomiyaensis TaxID=1274 RepID=UPI0028A28F24|nr:trypsin-like peptidase domain-containing protein [Dermacoccus nishinomiyaensis]